MRPKEQIGTYQEGFAMFVMLSRFWYGKLNGLIIILISEYIVHKSVFV